MIKKIRRALGRFSIIQDTVHKSYLRIAFELIVWVISNKGEINVYFDYGLFLKGKRAADYLKSSEFKKINKELNSPEYFPLLEDKYCFYQTLEGQPYRSPRNLFLIDRSGIYNLDLKQYITEDDFLQSDLDGFCKVINGFGGKMIYQLSIINKGLRVNDKKMSVVEFLQLLGNHTFLIQDRIVQHKAMSAINPSCVNTLRILTIRTGQSFQFYQGYLRVGINNNYVDNGAMGNLMIGFDKRTGKLMKQAYLCSEVSASDAIERHPQTNIIFDNYQIPYYDETVEMVNSLHQLFRQFFMIGWDIGITPDGPVVIEGNNITTLYAYQVLYGGQKASFQDLAMAYQNLR
jgi:hypothetical protein